jgi:hypothetical protein
MKTNNLIKIFYKQIKWKYRITTSSNRSFPDFIIIGAQKSGTTSLYHYLCQHPQLLPSYKKEVHFFDGGIDPSSDNFDKGEFWYRAHFPLKEYRGHARKTFEASPLYIFNPIAPERIYNLIPNVKLIAILRNPVDRAISHYFHEKRKEREPLSIMDALLTEEDRLNSAVNGKDYRNNMFRHYSYKKRGIYYEQIIRYLKYFPSKNMLILNSEELFTKPHETLRRVFEFIDIDNKFTIENLAPRNVAKNKISIEANVYEYLEDYFQDYNRKLFELIGESFDWSPHHTSRFSPNFSKN